MAALTKAGFALPVAAEDFLRSSHGALLAEDVACWAQWYNTAPWYAGQGVSVTETSLPFHLQALFLALAEFRSLFDYRTLGRVAVGYRQHRETLQRATELYISSPTIGPRFRIQHGQNTSILANEIGSDFWINHNVTIGSNRGIPSVGNRVTIRTGAVVVGPIRVGDNVDITANAVVASNVPSNTIAFAPSTIFVRKTIGKR
jgi:serine acetyltransferase